MLLSPETTTTTGTTRERTGLRKKKRAVGVWERAATCARDLLVLAGAFVCIAMGVAFWTVLLVASAIRYALEKVAGAAADAWKVVRDVVIGCFLDPLVSAGIFLGIS